MQVDSAPPTTYQYDPLYRLTSVTYPEGDSTAYTYDPVGNRLTMTVSGVPTTYTYDDADQLTSVTPPDQPAISYSWDDNGNLTWRGSAAVGGIAEVPALASSGGSGSPLAAFAVAGGVAVMVIVVATWAWRTRRRGPIVMLLLVLTVPLLAEWGPSEAQAQPAAETFTYDHENRLVQAIVGGNTSIYAYNGDGLRVTRTVDQASISYAWDVAARLPVILQDSEGNTYVYGLDLISTTDNAGAQTYALYDGLGSTTDLVDGSGNSVASYGYDVFGAIRTQSGSSPNYWLFTGEQMDSESDLYYLRARHYDPSTGRFLSRDPAKGSASCPASQAPYPYVLNNPVRFADPLGLCGREDVKLKFWETIQECAEDIAECGGNGMDCVRDPLVDTAYWVNERAIAPVFNAVEYCLASGDRFFECLERAHLVVEGTGVMLMGAIIFGAGCVVAPVALSTTTPAGWTVAGVVCLEASIGAAAAGYAGWSIIQGAVSPWDEKASDSQGKE